MTVRKYRSTDRPELIALWERVFPDNPPHSEPTRILDAKLEVDDLIFVSVQTDGLVGACMAGYDGHRGWLYAVAVSPEYRRQGLGERLVKHAIKELKDIGCGKVNLQIRSNNLEVAKFYGALGFQVEDRMSMGMLVQDIY